MGRGAWPLLRRRSASCAAGDERDLTLRTPPTPPHRCAPPQVLSLADALCGTTLSVRTLDGRNLEVPVQNVVTPGAFKVIR